MPATRAKASALGAKSPNTKLLKQVTNKPALKTQKQKDKAKSGVNTAALKEIAGNAATSSASPTSSTPKAASTSALNSPSQSGTPQDAVSKADLQTLISISRNGQKKQEKQLDKLLSEVAALKASMQATDEKIDLLGALIFSRVMQVKQDVRDVFNIVAEIPDNLHYVSEYVSGFVERFDAIDETVNNIESKTEDLSVFEEKINNIDENVDDIKQTCAEEGTLQTSMQMMNYVFDHVTNPVAPINLSELLDQHTVMLNQIFKQVLRGR